MGNFTLRFSAPGLTPVDSGTIAVSLPTNVPNPLLLPLAVVGSAIAPNSAAYNALNIPSRSAGYIFTDPSTGTQIIKLTDSTWHGGNNFVGTDYARAGRMGRPDAQGRYYFLSYTNSGTRQWSISRVNINTGVVEKRCSIVDPTQIRNELCGYFSPTTPGIFYAIGSGAILRKFDVTGTTAVEVTGGGFPKTMTGLGSAFTHFNVSADDRWFCAMVGTSYAGFVAWDSLTDTLYQDPTIANADEPNLDANGRYVVVKKSSLQQPQIWDPVTGGVITNNLNLQAPTHMCVARGYAFGGESNAPGNSRWWNFNTATGVGSSDLPNFLHGNQSNSAGWVDQPADLTQWVCHQSYGGAASGACLNFAIGLFRLSGGATYRRTLCNTYETASGYYGESAWPSLSPDGRLVIFKSNMNGAARQDQFAAIVPTS